MDFLNKIYKDINNCQLKDNFLFFNDNELHKDTKIHFQNINKDYSLYSLYFYLLNKNLSHIKYMERCNELNVSPISLIDKNNIIEEIENYKNQDIGYYNFPNYHINNIEIPNITDKNYILVSNSFNNILDINNIPLLLNNNNKFKNPIDLDSSPFLSKSLEFEIKGKEFQIFNDFSNFTKDDWKNVKIVFVDNMENDLINSKYDFSKLTKHSLFFSTEENNLIKSNIIKYENNEIKNLDKIWDLILEMV